MCMYDDICFFRFIVCVCMMTYVSLACSRAGFLYEQYGNNMQFR